MPVYEYECPSCKKRKDLLRRVQERNYTVKCECGRDMSRTLGSPGLIFKGTGFYETDYKKKR